MMGCRVDRHARVSTRPSPCARQYELTDRETMRRASSARAAGRAPRRAPHRTSRRFHDQLAAGFAAFHHAVRVGDLGELEYARWLGLVDPALDVRDDLLERDLR